MKKEEKKEEKKGNGKKGKGETEKWKQKLKVEASERNVGKEKREKE